MSMSGGTASIAFNVNIENIIKWCTSTQYPFAAQIDGGEIICFEARHVKLLQLVLGVNEDAEVPLLPMVMKLVKSNQSSPTIALGKVFEKRYNCLFKDRSGCSMDEYIGVFLGHVFVENEGRVTLKDPEASFDDVVSEALANASSPRIAASSLSSSSSSALIELTMKHLGEGSSFPRGTLLPLLNMHKGDKNQLRIAFTRKDGNIRLNLSLYSCDGAFTKMNTDIPRNIYFGEYLKAASGQMLPPRRGCGKFGVVNPPVHVWLEIGPGDSATLTIMLLEASPNNSVIAIEGNEESAKKASRILPQGYSHRLAEVIYGSAGEVKLPAGVTFEGLVAEIIGYIASLEGFVAILHVLYENHPQLRRSIRTIRPAYFGTKFLPLNMWKTVDNPEQKGSLVSVGSKVAVIKNLDFAVCGISDDHQDFESYDSLQEFREGPGTPRRYQCDAVWIINTEETFSGLGFYTWYSQGGDTEQTTNSSSAKASATNWYNVFVPVSQVVYLRPGDKISVKSDPHVTQAEPSYTLHVKVNRGDEVTYNKIIKFDYKEVIGKMVSLKVLENEEKGEGAAAAGDIGGEGGRDNGHGGGGEGGGK